MYEAFGGDYTTRVKALGINEANTRSNPKLV
jgi:hypothetical protein